VVGSALGLGLALRKGKMKGVKMPFGPSLIAGAFIAILWGGNVWTWYLRLMGLSALRIEQAGRNVRIGFTGWPCHRGGTGARWRLWRASWCLGQAGCPS
jgi:hypothetical protein